MVGRRILERSRIKHNKKLSYISFVTLYKKQMSKPRNHNLVTPVFLSILHLLKQEPVSTDLIKSSLSAVHINDTEFTKLINPERFFEYQRHLRILNNLTRTACLFILIYLVWHITKSDILHFNDVRLAHIWSFLNVQIKFHKLSYFMPHSLMVSSHALQKGSYIYFICFLGTTWWDFWKLKSTKRWLEKKVFIKLSANK